MRKTIGALVLAMLTVAVMCAPVLAEAAPATAPMIDLTGVINAIIALIGAVLTYKVVPYMRDKMTDAQYKRTQSAVKVAVYAAEEIYKAGHGMEKLKYAQTYLHRKGYDVDLEQIKAAVKEMRDRENAWVEGPEERDDDESEE